MKFPRKNMKQNFCFEYYKNYTQMTFSSACLLLQVTYKKEYSS